MKKLIPSCVFTLITLISLHANAQVIALQCHGNYERYHPFRASPKCGLFAVTIESSRVEIDGLCDINKRFQVTEMSQNYIVFNQGASVFASINRLSGEFKYSENTPVGGRQLRIDMEFRGICQPRKQVF